MEQNIYKQAILEAKAIRAGAIANAKAALQEAIEPKIQEIVRMKLSEEYSEDELEEDYTLEDDSMEQEGAEMEAEAIELDEASLDEILAELEALEEGDEISEELNEEAEEEESEEEDETEEEEDGEEESEEEEGGEEDEISDETEVVELTLGDLKKVIADLLGQQEASEAEADVVAGDEMGDEEATLDEILASLDEEDKEPIGDPNGNKGAEIAKLKQDTAYQQELEEAKNTIESLQETLRDVNLLNAKLLYMNKIFKSKALTESQKIKVVKAFDRSNNVEEVKNTYETLKESFTSKKTQIQESIGFASKPAGVAPKANIVEADAFVSRWQKIAGIK
jgi:hypothetical protein